MEDVVSCKKDQYILQCKHKLNIMPLLESDLTSMAIFLLLNLNKKVNKICLKFDLINYHLPPDLNVSSYNTKRFKIMRCT